MGNSDFSASDRVLRSLDLEGHLDPFRVSLGDDFGFVLTYFEDEVRATLELGSMIRSLLDVAERRGHVDPQISYSLRANQAFRSRNLGVADDRDARFMELAMSGGNGRLLPLLEKVRQDAERQLFADGGLAVVNPPPLGKRQLLDLP